MDYFPTTPSTPFQSDSLNVWGARFDDDQSRDDLNTPHSPFTSNERGILEDDTVEHNDEPRAKSPPPPASPPRPATPPFATPASRKRNIRAVNAIVVEDGVAPSGPPTAKSKQTDYAQNRHITRTLANMSQYGVVASLENHIDGAHRFVSQQLVCNNQGYDGLVRENARLMAENQELRRVIATQLMPNERAHYEHMKGVLAGLGGTLMQLANTAHVASGGGQTGPPPPSSTNARSRAAGGGKGKS